MPTRKVTEREKLMMFARSASNDQLDEALEILTIERRFRGGSAKAAAKPAAKPATTKKPASKPATKPASKPTESVPGPPNPPKPENDRPQG